MKRVGLVLSTLLLAASLLAQTSESKLATIRGTVLDAGTSAPVPKVIVKLAPMFSDSDEDQSASTTTDEKGEYEFKSVKPGEYRIDATKTGYLRGVYGKSPSRGVPIGITEGAALAGIDIKMERGGVISGRVLNEDGEPFPNVSISAMRYRRIYGKKRLLPSGRAQTDDRGEYRLHDLHPDSYFIECAPQIRYGANENATDTKHGYATVFYPSALSTDGATAIKITSGSEEVANFSVSPSTAFTVKGVVTGADDGDIQVVLQRPGDLFAFAGPQAFVKDGKFEIKSVVPGTYTATAMSFKDGKQKTAWEKVTVADGDVSNVSLSFATGSSEIHGTVQLLATSKPDLSGISVSLQAPVDVPGEDESIVKFAGDYAQVGKDGTFTLSPSSSGSRVLPMVYTRHFEGWYVKSVAFGTRDVTDTGFIPTSGASLQIVVSPNAASVEGQVLDKDGKPFPGAHVWTVPEEGRRARHDLYQSATSDQRGYFEMRNLPPGNYKVIAVEDDEISPPFDAEFLKAHLSDAADLKAEEKGKYNLKVNVIPAEAAK